MNIVIIGNTDNFDIADSLINNNDINIVSGIVDNFNNEIKERQKYFLKKNGINEITFKEIYKIKPDICIILSYNTIIDNNYFKNTLLLNIHGGILPKWRGNHSNAWAIINGEKEVGYSLHEANEILDGGDIYYIFKVKIDNHEKYGEVIPKLRKGIIDNLPQVLQEIYKGKLTPISQSNSRYVYTSKLRKEDGIIKNWDMTSDYIYNLFRVMGSPFGTGVFFLYRDSIFEIKEMSLPSFTFDYIGIPGSIVYVENDFMYIKTANNIVKINKITKDGLGVDINKVFKIGMRL